MLARAEWRRRKLTKRLKEEEERIEEDEADTRKRLKSSREHHKKWEETRETRVGTWRDFAKKKGKKARLGPQSLLVLRACFVHVLVSLDLHVAPVQG